MGENIVTSDLSSFIKFEGGGEREKKKIKKKNNKNCTVRIIFFLGSPSILVGVRTIFTKPECIRY